MNEAEYFRHIRSIGAFPAFQALRVAREAAAMDKAANYRCSAIGGPGAASWEVLPDRSQPIKLSFSIKVY